MVPATPPFGSGSSTKAPCTLDRLSPLPAPSPVLGVSEAVPLVIPMATLVVGTTCRARVVPPTVSRSVSVSVSRFAATSATGAAGPTTFEGPKTPDSGAAVEQRGGGGADHHVEPAVAVDVGDRDAAAGHRAARQRDAGGHALPAGGAGLPVQVGQRRTAVDGGDDVGPAVAVEVADRDAAHVRAGRHRDAAVGGGVEPAPRDGAVGGLHQAEVDVDLVGGGAVAGHEHVERPVVVQVDEGHRAGLRAAERGARGVAVPGARGGPLVQEHLGGGAGPGPADDEVGEAVAVHVTGRERGGERGGQRHRRRREAGPGGGGDVADGGGDQAAVAQHPGGRADHDDVEPAVVVHVDQGDGPGPAGQRGQGQRRGGGHRRVADGVRCTGGARRDAAALHGVGAAVRRTDEQVGAAVVVDVAGRQRGLVGGDGQREGAEAGPDAALDHEHPAEREGGADLELRPVRRSCPPRCGGRGRRRCRRGRRCRRHRWRRRRRSRC